LEDGFLGDARVTVRWPTTDSKCRISTATTIDRLFCSTMAGTDNDNDDIDDIGDLTAAEIVRRRRRRHRQSATAKQEDAAKLTATVDLDEEIARLQAELDREDAADNGDDGDGDDSDSVSSCEDDDDNEAASRDDGPSAMTTLSTAARQAGRAGIISISAAKDERIESLPSRYLPAPPHPSDGRKRKKNKKKKTAKRGLGRDGNDEAGVDTDGRHSDRGHNQRQRHSDAAHDETLAKKTKNMRDEPFPSSSSLSSSLPLPRDVTRGLESAVREVLDSYVPRSSERLPFYCRVCAVQYANLDEFRSHQSTDAHIAAADVDRKVSYCKLCRKQLTSPAQLREHLQSRPHRDRLERTKQNHRRRLHPG
jgi:hypothetical protein